MNDVKIPPTPKRIDIAITGRCNLKCRYCFFAKKMAAGSDLPTDLWLTFFRELSRLGVLEVTLTGGEPFIRPDFFVLIDSIIENRMRYSILSNGTLIGQDLLSQFEHGKRLLRLNYIQVSIDGSRAEIHDQSRPNSFERALDGLRRLKSSGFPVTVRTTINRYNLFDLENIAHLLLEKIGLPSFSTNEAMPIGSGCRYASEVSLTPIEQAQAMEIMHDLKKRFPGRLTADAGPQAKLKMYSEMELARKTEHKAAGWKMGYLTACGCIFSSLAVRHDGAIVPCHMLSDLILGHIQTDSLVEIWQNHPIMERLRTRRFIPMSQVPGCEDCDWAPYCNGSCPGLAHQLTGDFNRANPTDCYRAFLTQTKKTHVM